MSIEINYEELLVPYLEGSADLTWEPFWKPEYMTEAARLELGMF